MINISPINTPNPINPMNSTNPMNSVNSTTDKKAAEDQKLKKACSEFEGLMLNFMFQSMKKTVGNGGLLPNSFQKDMYESMFTEKMSQTLAQEKGMGLGEVLYRQLSKQSKVRSEE